MGVKGLWKLLEPTGRPVSLESMEGKVLAVDVSIWLNQAMYGVQGHQQSRAHLVVLFNRICKLLYYKIRPIFVFDGTAPELKKHTLNARRKRKELAVARAQRATDRIVKNYLRSHALNAVSKRPRSKGQKGKLSTILPRNEKEASIFELPPLPENTMQSTRTILDEKEDLYLDRIDQQRAVEAEYEDLDDIDINSERFRSLPDEIQHEIITNIRESRRKPFWSRYNELPKKADDFSNYQLSRLLKKGKMSHRLDELQKDMKTKTSGDLAILLDYETRLQAFEAGRVASEDTKHYILINKKQQREGSSPQSVESDEEESSRQERLGEDNSKPVEIRGQNDVHIGMDIERYFETNTDYDDIFEVPRLPAAQGKAISGSSFQTSGESEVGTPPAMQPPATRISSPGSDQDDQKVFHVGITDTEQDSLSVKTGLKAQQQVRIGTSPETYNAIKHEVWKFFSRQDVTPRPKMEERKGVIVDEEEFRGAKRRTTESEEIVSKKLKEDETFTRSSLEMSSEVTRDSLVPEEGEMPGLEESEVSRGKEVTLMDTCRDEGQDVVEGDQGKQENVDSGSITGMAERIGVSLKKEAGSILTKQMEKQVFAQEGKVADTIAEIDHHGMTEKNKTDVEIPRRQSSRLSKKTKKEEVSASSKQDLGESNLLPGSGGLVERGSWLEAENNRDGMDTVVSQDKEISKRHPRRSSIKTTNSQEPTGLKEGNEQSEVRASSFHGESEVNLSDEYDSEEETMGVQEHQKERKMGEETSKVDLNSVKEVARNDVIIEQAIPDDQLAVSGDNTRGNPGDTIEFIDNELKGPGLGEHIPLPEEDSKVLAINDVTLEQVNPDDKPAVSGDNTRGNPGDTIELIDDELKSLGSDEHIPLPEEDSSKVGDSEPGTSQQTAIDIEITPTTDVPQAGIFSSELMEDSLPGDEEYSPEEVPTVDQEEFEAMQANIAAERYDLEKERSKGQKLAASVTEAMYSETKELLVMFGIPYIESPQEAEAQCAYLDMTGQCEGTITDDSDVWLFGGQRVYKNFFTKDKDVLFFHDQTIERQLTLDRHKLINLGLLMGSDYTIGIQGVGAVTAMEIISEFDGQGVEGLEMFRHILINLGLLMGSDCTIGIQGVGVVTAMEIISEFGGQGIEGLEMFREWWELAKDSDLSSVESKVRSKLVKFHLPSDFPSPLVVRAYLDPEVDKSEEKFTWTTPDLDLLRTYAEQKLGWIRTKTDDILLPVMKRLREKVVQGKISSYFFLQPNVDRERQKIKSKRVQDVLQKLSGTSTDQPDPSPKKLENKGRKQSKDSIRKSQEIVSVSEESDQDRAEVARIAREFENHRGRHVRISNRKLFAKNNKGIGRSWKKQSIHERRISDEEQESSLGERPIEDQMSDPSGSANEDQEEGILPRKLGNGASSGSKVGQEAGNESNVVTLSRNNEGDSEEEVYLIGTSSHQDKESEFDPQSKTQHRRKKSKPPSKLDKRTDKVSGIGERSGEQEVSHEPAGLPSEQPAKRGSKTASSQRVRPPRGASGPQMRRGNSALRREEFEEEYRIEDEVEPKKDEKEVQIQAKKRARRNPYLKKQDKGAPQIEKVSDVNDGDNKDFKDVADSGADRTRMGSRHPNRKQLLDEGPKSRKRGKGKGKQLLNSRTRFKSLQQYSQLNLSESSSSDDN